ncbi:hypothetical protein HMPREF0493_0230 [Lactobacillus amylolyticus DSM 11664]|uniref:Uncharacterized protein n=1 Tax=Lactobacillus amylolyticus DSM 11664 TaxID=585524 RepID=D4YRV2_9LACO|nr:hypothetical protein HMPREF0493_0230 [Lactobacillus amylolyticus DSM 11664]
MIKRDASFEVPLLLSVMNISCVHDLQPIQLKRQLIQVQDQSNQIRISFHQFVAKLVFLTY